MTDEERADALAHWHDLAVAVLTAAGAALGGEGDGWPTDPQGPGVIVLEGARPGGAVRRTRRRQTRRAARSSSWRTPARTRSRSTRASSPSWRTSTARCS